MRIVDLLPGYYNANGVVDAADYTMWRDHRGQFVTPQEAGSLSGAATTPEPTSGVLVVAAGLAWLAARPRIRRRIASRLSQA